MTRRQKNSQMMRVGLSGVLSTSIDVGALIMLVEIFGVYVTIAAFLAALAGGIANFLVNKFWAFADRSSIDLRQIATYAFVSLMTGVFVAGAVHIFAVGIGLPYLIAKAIAAALVFVAWSYPAQAKLVFKRAGDQLDAAMAVLTSGEVEAPDATTQRAA